MKTTKKCQAEIWAQRIAEARAAYAKNTAALDRKPVEALTAEEFERRNDAAKEFNAASRNYFAAELGMHMAAVKITGQGKNRNFEFKDGSGLLGPYHAESFLMAKQFKNLDAANVASGYDGESGSCCCGCAGTTSTTQNTLPSPARGVITKSDQKSLTKSK